MAGDTLPPRQEGPDRTEDEPQLPNVPDPIGETTEEVRKEVEEVIDGDDDLTFDDDEDVDLSLGANDDGEEERDIFETNLDAPNLDDDASEDDDGSADGETADSGSDWQKDPKTAELIAELQSFEWGRKIWNEAAGFLAFDGGDYLDWLKSNKCPYSEDKEFVESVRNLDRCAGGFLGVDEQPSGKDVFAIRDAISRLLAELRRLKDFKPFSLDLVDDAESDDVSEDDEAGSAVVPLDETPAIELPTNPIEQARWIVSVGEACMTVSRDRVSDLLAKNGLTDSKFSPVAWQEILKAFWDFAVHLSQLKDGVPRIDELLVPRDWTGWWNALGKKKNDPRTVELVQGLAKLLFGWTPQPKKSEKPEETADKDEPSSTTRKPTRPTPPGKQPEKPAPKQPGKKPGKTPQAHERQDDIYTLIESCLVAERTPMSVVWKEILPHLPSVDDPEYSENANPLLAEHLAPKNPEIARLLYGILVELKRRLPEKLNFADPSEWLVLLRGNERNDLVQILRDLQRVLQSCRLVPKKKDKVSQASGGPKKEGAHRKDEHRTEKKKEGEADVSAEIGAEAEDAHGDEPHGTKKKKADEPNESGAGEGQGHKKGDAPAARPGKFAPVPKEKAREAVAKKLEQSAGTTAQLAWKFLTGEEKPAKRKAGGGAPKKAKKKEAPHGDDHKKDGDHGHDDHGGHGADHAPGHGAGDHPADDHGHPPAH